MKEFRMVPVDAHGLNDGPFLRIESVLSDILDKLFFAFDTTKKLREGVADLDRLLEPANLTLIHQRMQGVAELMDEIDRNSGDAKAFVQDLRDNSRKMSMTLRELSKIIQSSNIVSLNARIIAQGHRHRPLGSQLVRLAESLSDISSDASGLVNEMFDVIDSIVAATEDMGGNVEQRAKALFSTLKPRARALETALGALEQGMTAAQSASAWLSEFVAVAERDVSEVISALQVGDRSRQRAEHVRVITGRASLYPAQSTEGHSLILLAKAQMQQTVTEAVTDTRKASSQFADLAGRQNEFLARCREIAFSFEDSARMLNPAEHDSGNRKFDFAASAKAQEKAQHRLQEADESLGARSKTLSDCAFQMQLAALNTIITCARGFKEAMDMIMISQQINEVISEAPVTFELFAETMDMTKQRVTEWASREVSAVDAEIEGIGENDPTLDEAQKVLAKLLPSLTNDAPQIAQAISSSADTFLSFFRELEQLAQQDPVEVAPLPLADAITSETFALHLDEIRASYTMQEERNIHDIMFAELNGKQGSEQVIVDPEPQAASAATEDDDLSDIFF
ncbi:hypothetical protein TG4357_01723 [Thalassovita gelatinovora]|uniref:Methyl-accepting chemotaxis protein n=1 Tax=Thalassovita gelatinovora TaxID=53501 RepID=A0A0P1FAI9_THAGE|nr:hypothetical protein [Thalassovita gelatinovora]QIZ80648.1 hypothetical protein HFZ77_09225 [Thalassovita gelatinovora]CUH65207.1 hypothetical protein TG4357_01723 [Thalassovita gelatinovora]SEQ87470.1 hypothetical protein SAMN04488043_11011 [Thalassovita gelatinovora]